tara:strand:- start:704 stop:940 length:237 start_codon:yes stop_codon:yes gene_type:complete
VALKTFNLDAEVYGEFSKHCKKEGISMSKRVENFIRAELEQIGKGVEKSEKKSEKSVGKVEKRVRREMGGSYSSMRYG